MKQQKAVSFQHTSSKVNLLIITWNFSTINWVEATSLPWDHFKRPLCRFVNIKEVGTHTICIFYKSVNRLIYGKERCSCRAAASRESYSAFALHNPLHKPPRAEFLRHLNWKSCVSTLFFAPDIKIMLNNWLFEITSKYERRAAIWPCARGTHLTLTLRASLGKYKERLIECRIQWIYIFNKCTFCGKIMRER